MDALAKILTDRQFLTAAEAERWLKVSEADGAFLEMVLIRERILSREELLEILENHYFCPAVNLRDWGYDVSALTLVPRKLALRHLAFPVKVEDGALLAAFGDPDSARSVDAIRFMAHLAVKPAVALRHDIHDAILKHYGRLETEVLSSETKTRPPAASANGATPGAPAKAPMRSEEAAPALALAEADAIKTVDMIFDSAIERGATDIHIETGERDMTVRLRIDGILHSVASLSNEAAPAIISRIKIISGMDIAERRLPQDGRYSLKKGERLIDARVSTLPSQFGEKAVIRLLVKNMALLELDNLHMPPAVRKAYQEVLDKPQGFFLVTGPTGSGKTTTLYATLNAVDRESVNVITLEDPIEYSLPKITQVQMHEAAGLTFATGLRAILRQDPDVVLVGEIRDMETAAIACRAALTGHKVFSTLHTNDASQAVIRLLDMGVTPHLITAALRGVLAQRLVRVVCAACKETYEANETEMALLGYPKSRTLYRGVGCPQCSGTGYKGRMAIYEYLRVDENMHRLVLEHASAFALRHAAQANGMIVMGEFARRTALEGHTTVAEIQRAILSEEGQEQVCGNCKRVVNVEFTVCPFCQHVLKEKCPICSNLVEPSWEACPTCGHELEHAWKSLYCRHCLAPVEQNWDSCPYCGGEL